LDVTKGYSEGNVATTMRKKYKDKTLTIEFIRCKSQ